MSRFSFPASRASSALPATLESATPTRRHHPQPSSGVPELITILVQEQLDAIWQLEDCSHNCGADDEVAEDTWPTRLSNPHYWPPKESMFREFPPIKALASSAPASTLKPSHGFRFLGLPPELRSLIYSFLLISPKPLKFLPPTDTDVLAENNHITYLPMSFPSFSVSILRCNKQIHYEASAVLYGLNTFAFWIGNRPTGRWFSGGGPGPYNTSLALEKSLLRRMRRVEINLLVWRGDQDSEKPIWSYKMMEDWITAFCREYTGGLKGADERDLDGWECEDEDEGEGTGRRVKIMVSTGEGVYSKTRYGGYAMSPRGRPDVEEEMSKKDEKVLEGLKILGKNIEIVVEGLVGAAYAKELMRRS